MEWWLVFHANSNFGVTGQSYSIPQEGAQVLSRLAYWWPLQWYSWLLRPWINSQSVTLGTVSKQSVWNSFHVVIVVFFFKLNSTSMKFYQGRGLNGDMPRSLTSPLCLESWVSNSTMSDISLPFQAWKNFASALVTKNLCSSYKESSSSSSSQKLAKNNCTSALVTK